MGQKKGKTRKFIQYYGEEYVRQHIKMINKIKKERGKRLISNA